MARSPVRPSVRNFGDKGYCKSVIAIFIFAVFDVSLRR